MGHYLRHYCYIELQKDFNSPNPFRQTSCHTSQLGCQQLASCRNSLLQYVHCSHKPEKTLSYRRELISLHLLCLDAGRIASIPATMASTTHSHHCKLQSAIIAADWQVCQPPIAWDLIPLAHAAQCGISTLP